MWPGVGDKNPRVGTKTPCCRYPGACGLVWRIKPKTQRGSLLVGEPIRALVWCMRTKLRDDGEDIRTCTSQHLRGKTGGPGETSEPHLNPPVSQLQMCKQGYWWVGWFGPSLPPNNSTILGAPRPPPNYVALVMYKKPKTKHHTHAFYFIRAKRVAYMSTLNVMDMKGF